VGAAMLGGSYIGTRSGPASRGVRRGRLNATRATSGERAPPARSR